MRKPDLRDGRYLFSSREERQKFINEYFKNMVPDDQSRHPGAFRHGSWIIKLGPEQWAVTIYWEGDE